MKGISSEIEISTSAEKVWQVLTDFDSFPEWNPFIKMIEGKFSIRVKGVFHAETSGDRSVCHFNCSDCGDTYRISSDKLHEKPIPGV